jgi:hypothetical protein
MMAQIAFAVTLEGNDRAAKAVVSDFTAPNLR